MSASVAERRQLLVQELARLLRADMGIWAWGRGFSADGGIQPVAHIDVGMTIQHQTCLAEMGLNPKNDMEFRAVIIQRMGESRQITVARKDVYSDAEWDRRPYFRLICEGLEMTSWVMSLCYPGPDTWTTMTYWRKDHLSDLGERERRLLNLAFNTISWIQPTAVESIPGEVFAGLTHRQRTVLLLLLGGHSRKSIAAQLGVTEHTVGDHIKLIYQHFHVHSVNELAAKMLRAN